MKLKFLKIDRLCRILLDAEHALVVEHEAYAAAGSERTAALGEVAADVGHGPGVVVGCGLDEICDSVRAVSFEYHLLEVSDTLVGSLLDSPFDVLLRHLL